MIYAMIRHSDCDPDLWCVGDNEILYIAFKKRFVCDGLLVGNLFMIFPFIKIPASFVRNRALTRFKRSYASKKVSLSILFISF